MNTNFLIMGVQRSGNHAIIYWLVPQINAKVRHFNNHAYFNTGELKPYKPNTCHNEDNQNGYINIISLENIMVEDYLTKKNLFLEKFNYELRNLVEIVIIRNPWNMLASQFACKHYKTSFEKRKDNIVGLWLNHYKNYFKKSQQVHYIIFDEWFTSFEYRKDFSKKMGLMYSEKNLNLINVHGGGVHLITRGLLGVLRK